jgi:serine phosphatase RsbU (regulator of sigma subunit)
LSIWSNIYNIGVKESDAPELIRKKRVNNQVTLFTSLATAFFIPYLVVVGNYYFLKFEIATVVMILCAFAFNHFGLLNVSMFWRFVVILIDVGYASIEMPGAGFEYFLIPLGLIPFILSEETVIQISLMLIALAAFFFAYYLLENGYQPNYAITHRATYWTHIVVVTMTLLLCALFVLKFKTASSKYEKVIHNQVKEINQQKQDILDSINYAKKIQRALFPPADEFHRTIKDYFVYYKPKDIVSGDFYWLEEHDNKIFVAVADCTGHGVPGAMMSVMCTNALSRAVKEMNVTMPSLILDKVDELLAEQFRVNKDSMYDGMDVCLCCLDLGKNTLDYSGAFNPLYKISEGNLLEIKADKQPIGKIERRKPFTNHSIQLVKGDCYYLFSDGFSDQFGGPRKRKFSTSQFKEVLTKNNHLSMNQQRDALKKTFEDWKGDESQIDDVCVMGFRV